MLETEFNLKPSNYNLMLLSGMILISLGAIMTLPWFLMIPGGVLVGAYGYYLITRYGLLKSKASIVGIKKQDGCWLIRTSTQTYVTNLCADSVVTSVICVLRFQQDHRYAPYVCVLFKDSVAEGQYRRLCVLCKC